jgi:O-methyltransferase domain/Dimerisation domain
MSLRSHDAVLWDLMRGALATRALALVADLRVAAALANGPRAVEDLAQEVGADADVLRRLLRALAADGVFAEETRGVFRNTPASEALLTDSRSDFAHLFGGIWHRAAGELDARAGRPPFEGAFGDEFWTWLAAHPDERAAFDRAMVNGTERRVARLAAVDWRGDETVVDVGGGNGATLVELLRHHPGLRGIVFDLPETTRDTASLGDRIEFVEGSFFERVPPGDVYLLGTILHDWDDESAAAILRTIHAAAPVGARLLIVDAVVPDGNEPHGAKWLDLLMLALFNGRERDEEQWRELLAAGGWEPVRIEDGLVQALPTAT